MATTYIQGLDPARYTEMHTYLHNELSNGRDLFPTDLTSAISKASKWLVASPKGPREAAQNSVYGAVGKPNNLSKPNKDPKGKGKEVKPPDLKQTDPSKPCAYCNKTGHSILKCFKLIKDQASAKSDGNLDNKRGTAAATLARSIDTDEETTGFTSCSSIGNLRGTYTAIPAVHVISETTRSALAYGGASTPS